jgi:DNA polymerase III subunit delta'
MKSIRWAHLVGQDRVKQAVSAAFGNGSLGHAYLFCGDEGCGTFAAAVDLAQAVLCESAEAAPCGVCPSCERVERLAHPDLNLVLPVSLGREHKSSDGTLNQKGWDFIADEGRARIRDPYKAAIEKGSANVPVEVIRDTVLAIQRGVLGNGMQATIVAGADLMNKESSNAFLKTLEEPPPRTLLILCTERPHDMLPTIVSRCQMFRFGLLTTDVIIDALAHRGIESEKAAPAAVAGQGSLGNALAVLETPLEEGISQARMLWDAAARGNWAESGEAITALFRGADGSSLERIFRSFLSLVRGAVLGGIAGAEKYITPAFARNGGLDAETGRRLSDAGESALAGLRANGNPGIVLVHFMMCATEILNGKKQ